MEMTTGMGDPILEGCASRKIVIELDYAHFLTPAGWINLLQIVSSSQFTLCYFYKI